MRLRGRIVSGLGRGAYFVGLKQYKEFFSRLLRGPVFCGTLNIELHDKTWREIPLKKYSPSNGMAPIYYAMAKCFSEQVLLIRPLKSKHPENIMEIVACCNLRQKYSLKNGDEIEILLDEQE